MNETMSNLHNRMDHQLLVDKYEDLKIVTLQEEFVAAIKRFKNKKVI